MSLTKRLGKRTIYGLALVIGHNFKDKPSLFRESIVNFSGRTSASIAFSPASKVGFIQFDLSSKKMITAGAVGYNCHPDHIDCFKDSRITEANLLRVLPGRELQFKKLNNPKPITATNPDFANSASGEIMESVLTTFTSKPFAGDSVDFVAATSTAETTVVFST